MGYTKLKSLMTERNIKQRDLADFLGVSRNRINLILNGQRGADFSGREIDTLCKHLDISADEYFFTQGVIKVQPDAND